MGVSEPGNGQSAEADRASVNHLNIEAPSTVSTTNEAMHGMESPEKVELNMSQEPDETVSRPTTRKKATKSAMEKKKLKRTYVESYQRSGESQSKLINSVGWFSGHATFLSIACHRL